LLDTIRTLHPDAPGKKAEMEVALAWLGKKLTDVLRSPVCPQPPRSSLKRPPSAHQQD
jgi:hypothetical protein